MNKYKILIFVFLFLTNSTFAQEVPLLLPQNSPQTSISPASKKDDAQPGSQPVSINVEFANCSKTYTVSSENLFLLTLAALSANNYKINEISSKSGYILFAAENKEFLSTVAKVNNQVSTIKITPANNSYTFSQRIVDKIFGYIENNLR